MATLPGEPGYTATEIDRQENLHGRPVEMSARNTARTIGTDGPTETFQEDDGELGW